MDAAVLQALVYAADIHAGQVDKAGLPYIGHVIRVARNLVQMCDAMGEREDPGAFYNDEAMQAAVLHDALEDQSERYALAEPGLTPYVRHLVRTLSRDPSESYAAFIERIAAGHVDAILIKLADLQDNLDPARRALLPEADREPPAKYLAARERLLRAVEHLGYRPPVIASTR